MSTRGSQHRLSGVLVALAACACGGTSETERPRRADGSGAPPLLDTTSCEAVVEAFEFASIEPFDEASVQDLGNQDPVGWWVSTDGTNPEYRPKDSYFRECEPGTESCTIVSIDADFATTEGGAPQLGDGETQCEKSPRYMSVESRGAGFSDWGMTFGANLRGALRDGREWDGVALWARRSEGSDASTFAFKLPDQYTSNQAATYHCRDGLLVENLCDAFGRGLLVDGEWRVYFLPFESLSQQGFGKASPLGRLEVEQIVGLSLEFGAGTWEFDLDEIVYYREK